MVRKRVKNLIKFKSHENGSLSIVFFNFLKEKKMKNPNSKINKIIAIESILFIHAFAKFTIRKKSQEKEKLLKPKPERSPDQSKLRKVGLNYIDACERICPLFESYKFFSNIINF